MRWQLFSLPVLAALLVASGKSQPQSKVFGAFQTVAQARSPWSYLGVQFVEVDADRASRLKLGEERGVEVINVEEGSPADNAGIKPDDILLSYNGETILGAQQFMRLVRETPPGRKVKIQLWRTGKTQTVFAAIGGLPSRVPAAPNVSTNPNFSEGRGFRASNVPNILMTWTNLALGVECEPVNSQLAQYFGVKHGVLLRSVAQNSVGERAGLKAGDVLTSLGDRSITSPDDLRRVLYQPGKPMPVSLVRDHKQLNLTVTPPAEDQQ